MVINPFQTRLSHLAILLEKLDIACPAIRFREHNQVQDGCIGSAIIRSMRDRVEMRQFAEAYFVQNFAGLCITIIIALARLVVGQSFKGTPCKSCGNAHILERNDQTIASEEGDKPGNTSSWHPLLIGHIQIIDAQCAHILDSLAIHPIDMLIGRQQRRTVSQPACLAFIEFTDGLYLLLRNAVA